MTARHDVSVWEGSLQEFRDRVAAATPTPGGGAVAAVAATLAAALLRMVCAIGLKSTPNSAMGVMVADITLCEEKLAFFAEEDVRVFDGYMAARKLRDASAKSTIQDCLLACAEVPLAAAEQVAKLEEYAAEIAGDSPKILASDLATARYLLNASRKALLSNVTVNLADLEDGVAKRELLRRLEALPGDANSAG
jgi:formiminotetrahydrofolate cyclodeaminase